MKPLRERLCEGDLEAWASPEAPLVLLGGALPAEQAQAGAVACLEAGGPRSLLLDSLVQAWWQRSDPWERLALLRRLSLHDVQGGLAHRRYILAGLLFARSLVHEAGAWQAELVACIETVERWAWGHDAFPGGGVLERAWHLRRDAAVFEVSCRNDPLCRADLDALRRTCGAVMLITGILAAADVAKLPLMLGSLHADPYESDDWEVEFAERLVGLLPSAVPRCPLLEDPDDG